MKITRREFIGGMVAGGASAVLAADKVFDGGIEDYPLPDVPARGKRMLPPGSRSQSNFNSKCVGCQACVKACPNGVLRPRGFFDMRPEMAFDKGWCRPECTKCSSVCPAGAIQPVSREAKTYTHIGVAKWHKDACLAYKDATHCTLCERHCPAKAIKLVALDASDPSSPKIPVVDEELCIGCGACEHHCPARPFPAMQVEGLELHRTVTPMSKAAAIEEALKLISSGGAHCVLVKNGAIAATASGRGIEPVKNLLNDSPETFKGAIVVDKVVGRAAAAFAIKGGAAKVVAITASEEARDLLKAHDIELEAATLVPQILNRDKSASCPLEASVKSLADPAEIVSKLME